MQAGQFLSGESAYFKEWFRKHDFEIIEGMPGVSFEGRGDCLVHFGNLIGGYSYRTDLLALEVTAGILGLGLIELKIS